MTATSESLPPLGLQPPAASDRGKWLVLLAAFLGWMFDGMEMGIFPLIASPALTEFKADVANRVNKRMGELQESNG